MREILTKDIEGIQAHYRPGLNERSSDEDALDEVLVKKVYRRSRSKFDVFPKERWLDLGANIGSFALYCKQRGAEAYCYEPDPECFRILKMNASGFVCHNVAVTSFKESNLRFYTSPNPDNFYRGTVVPVDRYESTPPVHNLWAGHLICQKFDGIKMDIEGSEGPLIDDWLIPRCEKLVMEYHTSRDSSVANLERRLQILKAHFHNVHYPKAYTDAIVSGAEHYKPRFDQLIFCWGAK